MKKGSSKIIKLKRNNLDKLLSKLAIFISIIMIVGGTIGMILVQNTLKESQDLRQQASVVSGKVNVTMSTTDLKPNKQGKILFYINTSGVQTDGVQLTFNIVSDVIPTPPVLTLLESAPLQLAYSEIETTSDGYLVSIIALPKQITQPFSSTSDLHFATLDLTPNKAGSITLNFDVENSLSTVHASNPPTDELTNIATSNFNVSESTLVPTATPDYSLGSGPIPPGSNSECISDADCAADEVCNHPPQNCSPDGTACTNMMTLGYCRKKVPIVSPSPEASPAISPSPTAIPATSPSPSLAPSPNPSPSPTIDPSIGGNQDIATCNESCAVNNDCDVNLRCYSGQCRLVTNVTSLTCSDPANTGLSFSCNEYCADTNECGNGLVCQNNRCRNPENVNSITCADLTVAQKTDLVSSCNESCSTNNDCAANLRCYQGACRLATNPGSYSCSASTKKTVSTSVYGGTSTSKGGTSTSGGNSTSVNTDTNTGKKDPITTTGSVMVDPDKEDNDERDITSPAGTDKVTSNKADSMNPTKEEKTAFDLIKNLFLANPKLPITLMGIGIGLVVALVLLSLLKKRKDDNDEPPMTPTGGMGSTNKYENSLQSKINTLKQDSMKQPNSNVVPPAVATPPMMSNPPRITPPPAVTAAPNITTPKAVTHTPTSGLNKVGVTQNNPVRNDSGEVFSSANKPNSMLDKLKNKNITPPSV